MLGEGWIDVECRNLDMFGEGRIDFETIKWVRNFLANDTQNDSLFAGMLIVKNLQKHTQNDLQIISLSVFRVFLC